MKFLSIFHFIICIICVALWINDRDPALVFIFILSAIAAIIFGIKSGLLYE